MTCRQLETCQAALVGLLREVLPPDPLGKHGEGGVAVAQAGRASTHPGTEILRGTRSRGEGSRFVSTLHLRAAVSSQCRRGRLLLRCTPVATVPQAPSSSPSQVPF